MRGREVVSKNHSAPGRVIVLVGAVTFVRWAKRTVYS